MKNLIDIPTLAAFLLIGLAAIPNSANAADTLFGKSSGTGSSSSGSGTTGSSQMRPNASNENANATSDKATPTLWEAFDKVNLSRTDIIRAALVSKNKTDTASLESLKKRVGATDIDLYEKIQFAIDTVAKNESFDADEPIKGRKLSTNAQELWRIKAARDKTIEDVSRSADTKVKPQYEALLKKALTANDFALAKRINLAIQRASRNPFAGKYRNGFERFQISENGVFTSSTGRKMGTRKTGNTLTTAENWKLRLSEDSNCLIEVSGIPGKRWDREE